MKKSMHFGQTNTSMSVIFMCNVSGLLPMLPRFLRGMFQSSRRCFIWRFQGAKGIMSRGLKGCVPKVKAYEKRQSSLGCKVGWIKFGSFGRSRCDRPGAVIHTNVALPLIILVYFYLYISNVSSPFASKKSSAHKDKWGSRWQWPMGHLVVCLPLCVFLPDTKHC